MKMFKKKLLPNTLVLINFRHKSNKNFEKLGKSTKITGLNLEPSTMIRNAIIHIMN